jgi:hypothetical protein
MLEMKSACETCGRRLSADESGAMICSFECTFCADCSERTHQGICPNCRGELRQRPTRRTKIER